MATNPPISIPPFNNVPAPGSGVKSDWAQQISHYVTENLARGLVARPVVVNADQLGVGATLIDLTGFALTFTVVAGRWYELTWLLLTQQNTAVGTQDITADLGSGAGGGVTRVGYVNPAIGALTVYSGALQFVGGTGIGPIIGVPAGSKTFKMRGSTTAGTMTVYSGALLNGRMSIKDIGSTVAIP